MSPIRGGYAIRQQCVAAGAQSGRVEFDIRSGADRFTLSVPVDYIGVSP